MPYIVSIGEYDDYRVLAVTATLAEGEDVCKRYRVALGPGSLEAEMLEVEEGYSGGAVMAELPEGKVAYRVRVWLKDGRLEDIDSGSMYNLSAILRVPDDARTSAFPYPKRDGELLLCHWCWADDEADALKRAEVARLEYMRSVG